MYIQKHYTVNKKLNFISPRYTVAYINKFNKGKNRHELLDKLIDKKISGEFSEDEALGEDIDSFPPLTDEMMIEVFNLLLIEERFHNSMIISLVES